MALDTTLYRDQFSDTVQQLAKGTDRSILRQFCNYKRLAGDSAFVDGIGTLAADVDTPADPTALSSVRTRRVHADAVASNSANETAANQAAMDTPHNEIRRQRTIFDPQLYEAAHWFNETDDVQQIISLKSQTTRQLMRKIARQQDKAVLAAVRASSVSRQVNRSTTSVNLPNSQKVALEYEVHGNKLTEAAIAEIREVYVKNDAWDIGQIVLAISPRRGRELIVESGDKIHSRDFVTADNAFSRGSIPNVYGFLVVEHPLVGDQELLSWHADGVTWGDFSGLLSDMANVPSQRFQTVCYIREHADVHRTDDSLCVVANIETTSAS